MRLIQPYYQDEQATIYHGDCLDIYPFIEPSQFDLLATDPPYGVSLSSGWNGRHGDCAIVGDTDCLLRDTILAMRKHDAAIIFGSRKIPQPDGVKAVLIWEKGEHVGMGDLSFPWKPNYEEVYIIGDGFQGRRDGSVLRFNAVAGCVGRRTSRFHPTEKPVDLVRYLLSRRPSRLVIDPFMGSGTTLRAAKDLGLRAIGIEIEEKYCEIAAERLRQEVFDFSMT